MAQTPKKPGPQQDDPEQSKRFIDMARDVEAHEDLEAFDQAFDKVVQQLKPAKVKDRSSQ